jgi:hypothetical protein
MFYARQIQRRFARQRELRSRARKKDFLWKSKNTALMETNLRSPAQKSGFRGILGTG